MGTLSLYLKAPPTRALFYKKIVFLITHVESSKYRAPPDQKATPQTKLVESMIKSEFSELIEPPI